MLRTGAQLRQDGGVDFMVWAPGAVSVEVVIADKASCLLKPTEKGYWSGMSPEASAGDLYALRIDGGMLLPDPVSRSLPEGVHGRTRVVDPDAFPWNRDSWTIPLFQEFVFYELHIGTFTPEGTFTAAAQKLAYLKALGVNCVELMPVAQFPGKRNWGYDGVSPYSVHEYYGGPEGLKAFVDSCHEAGIAVCLDVVYNHLGPEGNYFLRFGPYLTDSYRTPWGPAVNFDGPGSDAVRRYFIDNVRFWFEEYRVDALRLDAVDRIFDCSPEHILQSLSREARAVSEELGRPCYLIAESDLNDPRMLYPYERGGHGMHAQWCDDFHHSLHVSLTGEQNGYYCDFSGAENLVKALEQGFVYDGRYSTFRQRTFGASPEGLPLSSFIFSLQNHDQVGNRAAGDRLTATMALEKVRAAAALLLLSPGLPLLFMGEEYGERAPFQFFIDHGDPGLVEAVRKGRREEFHEFQNGNTPDPADPETFRRSHLDWSLLKEEPCRGHLEWYTRLLRLRRECGISRFTAQESREVSLLDPQGVFRVLFRLEGKPLYLLTVSLSDGVTSVPEIAGERVLIQQGVLRDEGALTLGPFAVLLQSV